MNKNILLLVTIFWASVTFGNSNPSHNNATKVFSLDGIWQLTGYNSDKSEFVTLEGSVPGQVHIDLHKAGLIPNPFWRDNAEKCQWPEHWEWRYRKTFDLPEGLLKDWVVLQFDGLDTFADIIVNGKKIGDPSKTTTNNMFLPYEFNANGYLKAKGNIIEVRFYPIEKIIGFQAKMKPLPGAFADPLRPYVRRIQSTFGWDWVHRFVTAGIWKSARIISYPKARVDNLFLYTKSINEKSADLNLEVTTTVKNKDGKTIELFLLDSNNKIVWEKITRIESQLITDSITIENPQLWWPNGYGKHPVYTLTAVLKNDKGKELHRKTVEAGIRTVEIEEIQDKDNDIGSSYTIIINGKRIFAKGANWVPADPFPARITDEKYELLITQAKEAGMNMLRVWGGGIYESDTFWHMCNKSGIMVSQDFMFACQKYPDHDKNFVNLLKEEFTANILLIRNNPSLIYWVGDNELGLNSKPSDNWWFKEVHQTVTAPLVKKLDSSRPFRITSPMGNDPETNNSPLSGDSHRSSYYEKKNKDYRESINAVSNGRFMSEYAVAGTPPKEVLLKFMTEEDFYTYEILEYHTKNNPYEPGITFFRSLEEKANSLYGNPDKDSERWISQMEYLHYEVVRLAMEASSRRKFYTSGILFWMFNDCWPASGFSLIDYWGNRKAGWYGASAGMRPIIAASEATEGKIKWWITSDFLTDTKVDVEVKVQPVKGEARWTKKIDILIPSNSSVVAFEFPLKKIKELLGDDAIVVCEVNYGKDGYDRAYWTEGLPQDVRYAKANIKVTQKKKNALEGEITITTENWARVVNLYADNVDFEDNYFELLPGEKRTINWKSRSDSFDGEIKVSCWNE